MSAKEYSGVCLLHQTFPWEMKNSCSGVYFSRPGSLKFLYLFGQGRRVGERGKKGVLVSKDVEKMKIFAPSVADLHGEKKVIREQKESLMKRNLLLASGISLETVLPGAESVLDSSVIGNVLGKRLGSIEMYIRAIGPLDRVVAVLLVDALCLFGECLFSLWSPPLISRKRTKKVGQSISKKASSKEKSKKMGENKNLRW